jgi:REP element-mobilizing transposase RayT
MSIFYDPYAHTDTYRRNLPHWAQDGKMYFVTFRLADSIPLNTLVQLESERETFKRRNPEMTTSDQWVEYYRLFSDRVEAWLDDNIGECLLARNECAKLVADSLRHFDTDRYRLDHWVIMPNHVHVLLLHGSDSRLESILGSLKSFSARGINKLCNRTGQLWQRESFDHIVRTQSQLDRFRKYIIDNASRSGGKALLSTAKVFQ